MIAIHHRQNSFSGHWIETCQKRNIPYQIVDCYDSHIIQKLKDFNILLWHWHQNEHAARFNAKYVIKAAETMGLVVFPSSDTCRTFDDKLGQKYQLEAIGAPLIETEIFFNKDEALQWIDSAEFPQVFKLRCGAGSVNVQLIQTRTDAANVINQAFSKGFPFRPPHMAEVKDYLKKKSAHPTRHRRSFDGIGKVRRYLQRSAENRVLCRLMGNEVGYIMFQKFIPNNQFDTRITVIGDKAFGFIRNVRPDDWRASGSGNIDYNLDKIDRECVRIAFDVSRKLNSQSTAFDFVMSQDGQPQIIEISYCYMDRAVYDCPGHWDRDLNWVEGQVWPQDAILDLVLKELGQNG